MSILRSDPLLFWNEDMTFFTSSFVMSSSVDSSTPDVVLGMDSKIFYYEETLYWDVV